MVTVLALLAGAALLLAGFLTGSLLLGALALTSATVALGLLLVPWTRVHVPFAGCPEAASQHAATSGSEPVAGGTERTRTATVVVDGTVFVVRGRHRYHVAGCAALGDRVTERLAHDEAVEEGFTACTRCLAGTAGGQD